MSSWLPLCDFVKLEALWQCRFARSTITTSNSPKCVASTVPFENCAIRLFLESFRRGGVSGAYSCHIFGWMQSCAADGLCRRWNVVYWACAPGFRWHHTPSIAQARKCPGFESKGFDKHVPVFIDLLLQCGAAGIVRSVSDKRQRGESVRVSQKRSINQHLPPLPASNELRSWSDQTMDFVPWALNPITPV